MNKNNSHYKKAMNSIKNNNVSDAIDKLKLCLKFNSKNVDALNLLGLSYYLKCRFDKAEKTWRKSLSLKKEDNKARDYLELITKNDFKEIRKEYKNILFNDEAKQKEKIKFLKTLIEEHDELIEPYVILGLLYKKKENYSEALKYFYQAYDLDSGNDNIKNYIMQCEKEDEKSSAFNIKSNTNQKSALIAGGIAVVILAIFLNLSGFSPLNWIEKNIQGFEFAQSQNKNQSAKQNSSSAQKKGQKSSQNNNSSNSTVEIDSKTEAEADIGVNENLTENGDNNNQKNSGNQAETKNDLNSLSQQDLLQYKNNQNFLSLENMKEIINKEQEKRDLEETSNFLEEGTEQQLFNRGMDYFSQGNYQEAAEIFKSIYNLTETDYLKRESLFLLARSYEKLDDYQSAEHFYRIYLNEYSETNYYDEAMYNLGLMLNEAGEEKKSKEVLERLRAEEPYSKYNNSQVYEILNQ